MLDPAIKVIPVGYDHHGISKKIKIDSEIYNNKVLTLELGYNMIKKPAKTCALKHRRHLLHQPVVQILFS